jgi:hypothetical protein
MVGVSARVRPTPSDLSCVASGTARPPVRPSDIFGPDRLRLLRRELAHSVVRDWREHEEELTRLKREQDHLEQSLYRQTLRLEEHDDPDHSRRCRSQAADRG